MTIKLTKEEINEVLKEYIELIPVKSKNKGDSFKIEYKFKYKVVNWIRVQRPDGFYWINSRGQRYNIGDFNDDAVTEKKEG